MGVSPKCKGVLSWAVPQEEAADEEVVTDELGMSDEDYKEKKECQKKKAEDRVSLEEFEKNDPEGYAQMMQQQAEEARQQAEFKKKERARAAALERAKKK